MQRRGHSRAALRSDGTLIAQSLKLAVLSASEAEWWVNVCTGRGPHILIVEDNVDTRTVLRLMLELDGMVVSEAADGIEALEQLRRLRDQDPTLPSVILLDWMMPRCSGDEFRRKQLADSATANVPVVVVSAALDRLELFRELAPFAILSKPVDPDQLLRVVRAALEPPASS